MARVQLDSKAAALRSLVRLEILADLQLNGPRSVREIAESLETPADGLYHHMNILEAAGLVSIASTRKVGRHIESVYSAAEGFSSNIVLATVEPTYATKIVDSVTRSLVKRFQRTAEAADPTNPIDTAAFAYHTTHLTDEDLKELDALRRGIQVVIERGKKRREGTQMVYADLVFPDVRATSRNHSARERSAAVEMDEPGASAC